MLTGNLVLVRYQQQRVIPRYIDRSSPDWLDVAESLREVFRNGVGRTRGEIAEEVEALFSAGAGTSGLVNRGLAKVLEDRAEFEVVAELPPETLRDKVFLAAAEQRRQLQERGGRASFRRDLVLQKVAAELGLSPERIEAGLFADLKEENRMLRFDDLPAQALLDRYNVALAQAVLLRCVRMRLELRNDTPAQYRQFFRWLKFHRLLYSAEGTLSEGYRLELDGPLSLFTSTTKYGLQFAQFLPAVLLSRRFRLEAELRWGPRREPRLFHLDSDAGLVSHYTPQAQYVPSEIRAFIERFRQIAHGWDVEEGGGLIELGRQGVWIPDYRFVHRETGLDVEVEILGFWKRASVDRLLRLLPVHGPPRYLLAVSERLKVDEKPADSLAGSLVRFKEVPNAQEMLARLEAMIVEARSK